MRIPVTGNYSNNSSTPKYYANSDILVDRARAPDSVKTRSQEQAMQVDFSKATPSGNPFIKFSIDRLTANYRISHARSSNPSALYNTSDVNSGSAGYSLDISQGNGIGIFSFVGGVPILKRLKETRLYWKPSRISANLSGSESLTRAMTRTGVYSQSYMLSMTRGFGTGFRPFQSLSMDATRTHRSDLSNRGIKGLFAGDLGRDNNVSQTVNSSYHPQLVSFLNTEATYRTTYGWNWGNNYAASGQNVSDQNSLTASVELRTQDVFGALTGRHGGFGQPPPGAGAPPPGEHPETGKEGEQHMVPAPGGGTSPMTPEGSAGAPPGKGAGVPPGVEPPSPPQGAGAPPWQHPPPEPSPGESGKQPEQPAGGQQPASMAGQPSTAQGLTPAEVGEPTPEGTGAPGGEGKPSQQKHPPTLLDGVKSLVKCIGNIRLDYSLTNNLSHPTVSGQADWRYQLGFARSPGVPTISGYTSVPTDSRSDDYRTSSVLNVSRDIRLNVDYHYQKTTNFGSTSTGSTERTQFFTLNRSQMKIHDFFVLNWSLNWSGLERTPIFRGLAQTVSLDNTFSGHRSDFWTGTPNDVNRVEYSRAFNPLAGLTINWKGGVNSSVRYTLTQNLTDQLVSGVGKTYATQTGLTAQVTYTRQTGFRIPLPFWPFKNRRFSNQTNFSLAFNMTGNRSEGSYGETGQLVENTRQSSWSIAPRIDYTFSNTVTGGVHLETGVNKDKVQGKTTFTEFGVSVNISIRG
jgi:hypothetical protein